MRQTDDTRLPEGGRERRERKRREGWRSARGEAKEIERGGGEGGREGGRGGKD